MTPEEVLDHYCSLGGFVQKEVFDYGSAADCFCGDNPGFGGGFCYDAAILAFIDAAVTKAVAERLTTEVDSAEADRRLKSFRGVL